MTDDIQAAEWDREDVEVDVGSYVWPIALTSCEAKDAKTDKPYMEVGAVVEDPSEHAGYSFDFRIYFHKKSEKWCRYFLKKFDYPSELLEREPPILRKSVISQLKGKVLVEIKDGHYGGTIVDVKGFDHLDGVELEERLVKLLSSPEEGSESDGEGATDVEADIKTGGDPFGDFDNLEDEKEE